mgnify:CR=1 FL=1
MARERFLTVVLRFIPPERRQQVRTVFAAGRILAESDNDVGVFLRMIEECAVEWGQRAR